MPSAAPPGEPAPADGTLPPSAASGADDRAFGVYIHVPFCTVRCGYCDFTTFTARELGGGGHQADYARTAAAEIDLARRVLDRAGVPRRPAATVFLGGGTPTVLPPGDLAVMLQTTERAFGLTAGAEVTVEANPDSVGPPELVHLAASGVTRMSFGMQSAVPHVLATLDRTHAPARVPLVVRAARDAGLAVSLDLIYGTPGESLDDWRRSLEAALACAPDHVSAYALVIEPGTRMAAQVHRGEVPPPDDDDLADKYELADDVLTAAGYGWYEVSNWARGPQAASRHNLGYWRGDDWWGVGPGAHSHIGGVRWWNVRHPSAYAARLADGLSPAQAREVLDDGQRASERVLLGVRLAAGLDQADLSDAGRAAVPDLVANGLADPAAASSGRVRLTRRGRLLTDTAVRTLMP